MNAVTSGTSVNPEYKGRAYAFLALIKREFWENRSLWIIPLVGLGVLLVSTLFSLRTPHMINSLMLEDGGPHSVKVHTHLMPKLGLDLRLGDVTLENLMLVFDQAPEFVRGQLLNLALYGLSKTFGFIMGFVLVFYLGTGLYRENRDRSVMFWKSMPVSDSAAIFSRLVVAFPIILAILLATVILAQFIVLGVFTIPAWLAGLSAWKLLWGPP